MYHPVHNIIPERRNKYILPHKLHINFLDKLSNVINGKEYIYYISNKKYIFENIIHYI